MRHPNSTDIIVAKNLRSLRMDRGRSLQDVAAELNLAYQQLQKYEKAQNRITVGILWELSQIYNTPIEWFFQTNT